MIYKDKSHDLYIILKDTYSRNNTIEMLKLKKKRKIGDL